MDSAKYKVYLSPAEHFALHPGPLHPGDPERFRRYLMGIMQKSHGRFTANGRSAMEVLFQHLRLRREDEVWVTTTFDYPNVSSCVTCTIFNHCKPSRVLTPATRAVLMIHEFGVLHPRRDEIASFCKGAGIPLIEDCAHSFLSTDEFGRLVGSTGDWTILSFPKFYPVHAGGMLLGHEDPGGKESLPASAYSDIAIASGLQDQTDYYAGLRKSIARRLALGVLNLGMRSLYDPGDEGTVGWFFPVDTPDARAYSEALRARQVECGIWHGSNVIVLPLHQYLTRGEEEYMLQALAEVHTQLG